MADFREQGRSGGLCPYCGAIHIAPTCPRVKSIQYAADGSVLSVELHPEPAGRPTDRVHPPFGKTPSTGVDTP